MKIVDSIKTGWRRALAWVDSREGTADEALRDAADKDWTARVIYGIAAVFLAVVVVLIVARCAS